MSFLKSRSGSTRLVGCPDVTATAPDGYTNPLVIDIASGSALFFGADWISVVTFLNSWANFGGGFQTLQYRKIGDIVYVRGTVAGGTVGANVCNLPVGYRPPALIETSSSANALMATFRVYASGDIETTAGSNARFDLNFQFAL